MRVAPRQWHIKIVKTAVIYERIDLAAVEVVMRALRIPGRDRLRVVDGIQEMEAAVLPVLNDS